MKKDNRYFRSMMSQRAITQTFFDGPSEYNASWDYAVSPDKRHFVSICAEGPKTDGMMYEYIPETRKMVLCTDTKKDIITYPRTIRPSKVHTCISFMEDGRVIFNNHTTAGAPSHPDWMVESYWNHSWEGYPGSNVMIYDPKTGKTEDLGIPVPRESIYGGAYDPIHRAYYFTGYFRGHGYRLDLDTRKVTDYGQVTEFSTYFHIKGPDGNIYFSTNRGHMCRYNVHTQEVDMLGVAIPPYGKGWHFKNNNVMAYAAIGPDNKIYMCSHRNELVYAYDIEKNTMETIGSPVPKFIRELYGDRFDDTYMIFGMDFDSNGVLWYGLKILGNCMRFVSWDIFNGGEPVDHGIVGTVEHASWNFCQAHIVDDIFYGSTTNHATDGPAVVAIDLKKCMEDVDKERELAHDPIVFRGTVDVDLYPGEEKLRGPAALDATEGVAVRRVRGGAAFADGKLRARQSNNQYGVLAQEHYVTKIWETLGVENSQVVEISHDENDNVIAITSGPEGYFRCVVKHGVLLGTEKIEYTPKDPNAVAEKYKDVILPALAGRSWLAEATCEAELADGSMLVGTKGGCLAIVKDGKSFNLGAVSMTGAIHDLAVSPDKKAVYGVAGDKEDVGLIFSYSMETGIVNHGMLFFENGASSPDGVGVSCEPCCIDYSNDGKSMAIGVRDRLGCVYEYTFEEEL